MKRALITGIAGSGGSHLAEYLVDNEEIEVHGVSRWHSTTSNKNLKRIRWSKPVHERLLGATKDTMLPYEEEWSFYHVKTIIKQEKQNEFYGGILKNA